MRNVETLSLAIAFLALGAAPGSAQSQGLGLEVTAGYNALSGEDFDAFSNDLGFEVIGSHAWASGWELGIGTGIALHDFETGVDRSADIVNVFGEGRYRFGVPGTVIRHPHPFIVGRLGYSRLSLDLGDEDVSQDGLLAGFGGGVEYWLTNEVGLVGGAMLHLLSYDSEAEIPVERDGAQVSLRGGMKLRFAR